VSKLISNTRILAFAEAVNVLAGMATVVSVARILDARALGLYSFSFALGSVVAVACLYGANDMIVREIARSPSRLRELFGNALAARALPAAALMALLVAGLAAGGYGGEKLLTVLLLATSRLADSFLQTICAFFRGLQDMKREAVVRAGLNTANLAAGLAVLIATRSLFWFAAAYAMASVVVLAAACRFVMRRYGASLQYISAPAVRAAFLQGLNFTLFGVLLVVYVQTNTILLGLMKGELAAGFYAAGFRFVSALGLLATAATGAVFPVMAKLNVINDAEELKATYLRCSKGLMALGAFFGAGLFVFSPRLISLFYGDAFGPAVPALRVMSFSILFAYANACTTTLLFAVNREGAVLRILSASVAFVFLINLLLLPAFGHMGAAWTTLLPELFFFGLQYAAVRKCLPGFGLGALALKTAGLMAGLSLVLVVSAIPPAAQAAALILLFLAGLRALRVVEPREWLVLARRPAAGAVA
jgi:O-antigen/teichoic acid export membrane protein